MQIILLSDVKGLGKAGDVVKASDGYARNMLFPKKLAVEATESNKRDLERKKAIEAERRATDMASAKAVAAKLEGVAVKLTAKAGENDRLFGAITAQNIADALLAQHKIEVDKKKIVLKDPIKQLGSYTLDVKLYQDVVGKLKVAVEAE